MACIRRAAVASLMIAAMTMTSAAFGERDETTQRSKLEMKQASIEKGVEISGIRQLGPIGLSVRDIDRSARFYAALGFKPGEKAVVTSAAAKALGAKGDNTALTMQSVARDGTAVLLLQVTPSPAGEPARGAAAQPGLAHLELMVDDVDQVAEKIARAGGTVLDGTRSTLTDVGPAPLHMIFCRDPDGTLIVLVHDSSK